MKCLLWESWVSWEKMQTLCLTGWSVFVFGNQFSSDLILDLSEWVPLQMLLSSPTQSETWSYQRLALWHEFCVNICLTWNQFINIGLMRLRARHLTRSRFSGTLKSSRRGQESSVAPPPARPLTPGWGRPKIGKSLSNTLRERGIKLSRPHGRRPHCGADWISCRKVSIVFSSLDCIAEYSLASRRRVIERDELE